jgi:CheY-like chemotaxis protein
MSVDKAVDSAAHLAWPILVGLVVWRLFPVIQNVISSRGFSIKAGGAEITVQQASDQLAHQVDDLREQLSALKQQLATGAPIAEAEAAPVVDGVARLRSVLWVDDHPENNVYEVQALERKGVSVVQKASTEAGLDAVHRARAPFDAVITDMGREEGGRSVHDAGLKLVERLRADQVAVPVVVYASAGAVGRNRDRLIAAGATEATASATELLEILGRIGQGADAPAPAPVPGPAAPA